MGRDTDRVSTVDYTNNLLLRLEEYQFYYIKKEEVDVI